MKRTITKKSLGFWLVAAVVLLLDRITKELAPGLPADGFTLIPGVIGLRYAENTGIAFSLLSGLPRLTGILAISSLTNADAPMSSRPITMPMKSMKTSTMME